MIIENASGISIGEYMDQKILTPLNMENTIYKSSPGFPDLPGVVNSYFEHFPKQIQNGTDVQKHFSNIAYGHEGIIASPYDFAKFMKLLVTGNVLSAESTSEMLDMNTPGNDTYGLGIKEYKTTYESGFGHTGGSIGTMSYAIYFPESDISFSICCNLGGVFVSENTEMFYEDLYEELIKVIFTGERN
jgi:D-alanyl-D-alanine carboxypeptidase